MDIKEIKNGLIYDGVVHELVAGTAEDLEKGLCETCSFTKECDHTDIAPCNSFGARCRKDMHFKIHANTRLEERNYIARELFIRRNGEMLNDSFNTADEFIQKCYGVHSQQKEE